MIEQQVPDADYYIFDDDRTEEHIKQDQVSLDRSISFLYMQHRKKLDPFFCDPLPFPMTLNHMTT